MTYDSRLRRTYSETDLKELYQSAYYFRQAITEVLDKEVKNCYNRLVDPEFLAKPNLTERVAHETARIKELTNLLTLLNPK